MTNEIGAKIENYAKTHIKELKQEEAKSGKKFTKYDIAMQMLSSGKLNEADFTKWISSVEGNHEQAISRQQAAAIKNGNIWGVSGYIGGGESYLDSLVSFSEKTPIEQDIIILSPRANKLNETIAEKKRQAEEFSSAIAQRNLESRQITNPEDAENYTKEIAFYESAKSMPEIDGNYKDLMFEIEFQKADKKKQVEMLLKKTGEQFYEAKERGDKSAMKEQLIQGLGLTFAYMDNKAGITDAKDLIKKYSGLNALVDAVDKFVDDGDVDNATFTEKAWAAVKGVGDAVDSFIGTQGAAMMGTLFLAGEAAAAAGIGEAFSIATQGYFAYEGGSLMVDGAETLHNADTVEEARTGGQELGTGAIMLGGAVKSFKAGRNNAARARAEKEIDALLAERKNIHETNNTNNNGISVIKTGENVTNKAELTKAYQENPELVGRLLKSTQEYTKYVGSEHLHYDMVVPSYSTEAVVTIARYSKTNPEAQPLLERALSHSENIKDVAQLELIAKECINNPQKVESFLNTKISASPYYNSTDGYNSFDHYMAIRLYNVLKEGTPADLLSKIKPEAAFDMGGEPVVVYRMPKETTINTAGYGIDVYAGDLVLRRGNSYEVLPAKERLNGDNFQGYELGKAYFQAVKEGKLVPAETGKAATPATTPTVHRNMSVDAMREVAKTPEGIKQLEDAGLVITKNTVSSLKNIHEGQSQSPARQIKKLDLSGTPEEVVAKNPGLKYDTEQGKFFREVSWDGGKTIERMYVDASDPKGYFMIQYGKESWDGALIGGTEVAKSYVEPGAYNATGTKNYLNPETMGYGWTEASKAAPVRFAEVPEGVKGVVGKEGFQPFTGPDQVIAIDVKGQPYINTTSYIRNNTKGLSQNAVKVLDKVEGKTAQKAPEKPSVSKELQEELYDCMFFSDYYPNKITTEDISLMITKYPEVITRLAECKTPEGELLIGYHKIIDFCFDKNIQKVLDSNPKKLFAILDNPRETTAIMKAESPIARIQRALLAESRYPEFMNKLLEYNTPDGQQLFDYVELASSILNPNKKYAPEVFELLDNPRDISYIKSLKYEDRANAIRSALYLTGLKDGTSPISRILRSQLEGAPNGNKVWDMIDKYPEVVTKLAEYKAPDGEPLFKPAEINGILSNCKSIVENNPQAIYDILDNPQSLTRLSTYEDKGVGLFKMIYY